MKESNIISHLEMQGDISLAEISSLAFMNEERAVRILLESVEPLVELEEATMERATLWTSQIRDCGFTHGVESFLKNYSLDSGEGVALMCLAEALLRIPDRGTVDALIRTTFEGHNWEGGTVYNDSWLVSLSRWGLFLTGKMVDFGHDPHSGILSAIKKLVSRTSEPIIREALKKAMGFIGGQFVLAETVAEAITHSRSYKNKGYNFSYDMLGEGARSDEQAKAYVESYKNCISQIGAASDKNVPLFQAPSISVKLSALHPRYQLVKSKRVLHELLPRLTEIVLCAKRVNITVSIDAEESSRLDMELELFAELLKNPELVGWNGVSFVLQAYQKRAFYIIDWLVQQARFHNRVIPLRLVKGAYWDSEIKAAQLQGLPSYPVFTSKEHTDVSYLACANKIMQHHKEFYPQLATHNARTISSIVSLSKKHGWEKGSFEFQRLHGMGESLHDMVVEDFPSRIYAPIGEHKDLLAYLIRRLLENGANSSFVHLLMDSSKTTEEILADPIAVTKSNSSYYNPSIPIPEKLYAPQRKNSLGIDFGNQAQLHRLLDAVTPFVANPVAAIAETSIENLNDAVDVANKAFLVWAEKSVDERAEILERCADLLEENAPELIALCAREAGKTLQDGVAEVREAADFCRYYAAEARKIMTPVSLPCPTGESNVLSMHPRGIFACISPWNFPLAIFMGQMAAALVTGNCVIAKPAEQTPAIAARAVEILYEAGVPKDVLRLAAGKGEIVGAALVANQHIGGVVFTGSLETAKHIQKSLAERGGAIVPFIAETGGQNCMVVDSSALLEQAVDDIILSAFGSAGQRCSSLRVLYVQEDIADRLLALLAGAMQELKVGDPLSPDTDIGAVIDAEAKAMLLEHIDHMKKTARLVAVTSLADNLSGNFIAPHAFEIRHISELKREVFGAILHIISFKLSALDSIIDEINSTGYGLTFGIHSRINEHVRLLSSKVRAGNIYVNRSMIGATVGVQPFGGEGLSGTGFKAGGFYYLLRFLNERTSTINTAAIGGNIALLASNSAT